jgi:hypothetical protein
LEVALYHSAFSIGQFYYDLRWVFSTTFELSNNFLNGLIGLCLFSLICILLAIHRSYEKWVFNSELGHVDLIELLNNHPNKASYTKFMA